jgi:uncharacterized protein (UPF0335 family)
MQTDEATADKRLRLLIERIETLEETKREIMDDIKDVYSEAKIAGYDVKALKAVVRLRKKTREEREAEEAIIDLYKERLGL